MDILLFLFIWASISGGTIEVDNKVSPIFFLYFLFDMNIKRYSTWHWILTGRIKGEMGRYQLPWQGKVRETQSFVICKENLTSRVCNEGSYFSSLGSVNRIYYLSFLPSLNTDLNFHCNVLYACIAVYLYRVSNLLSEAHRSSYSLWKHLYISRSFNSSVFCCLFVVSSCSFWCVQLSVMWECFKCSPSMKMA